MQEIFARLSILEHSTTWAHDQTRVNEPCHACLQLTQDVTDTHMLKLGGLTVPVRVVCAGVCGACQAMDEIWVPTQFNKDSFAAAGRVVAPMLFDCLSACG